MEKYYKPEPIVVLEKEIVIVHSKYVVCAGPDAPHDHPIVYYQIPKNSNEAVCFYCSRKFVYEENDT